ncbi:hypothetical protein DPMN_113660 [Dreissena polymorpha]|uniref:Uncharacterized protein n=1 Tax=Dreissena polymorpha TaxID=45954 RepID=A0A9D4KHT2_DREPO|nr:hypothetical protein DPMN_113660 [Dreissena polymorpha]
MGDGLHLYYLLVTCVCDYEYPSGSFLPGVSQNSGTSVQRLPVRVPPMSASAGMNRFCNPSLWVVIDCL